MKQSLFFKRWYALLLMCLIASVSAWADADYELKLNNGATGDVSYFTLYKGSVDTAPGYHSNYTGTYNGFTSSKGLKMESNTKLEFTISSGATSAEVVIVQSTNNNSSNTIKFGEKDGDLSALTSGSTDNNNKVCAFTKTGLEAGKTYQIARGSGETGIIYVKVTEYGVTKGKTPLTLETVNPTELHTSTNTAVSLNIFDFNTVKVKGSNNEDITIGFKGLLVKAGDNYLIKDADNGYTLSYSSDNRNISVDTNGTYDQITIAKNAISFETSAKITVTVTPTGTYATDYSAATFTFKVYVHNDPKNQTGITTGWTWNAPTTAASTTYHSHYKRYFGEGSNAYLYTQELTANSNGLRTKFSQNNQHVVVKIGSQKMKLTVKINDNANRAIAISDNESLEDNKNNVTTCNKSDINAEFVINKKGEYYIGGVNVNNDNEPTSAGEMYIKQIKFEPVADASFIVNEEGKITITNPVAGATYYYTTDGSTPTEGNDEEEASPTFTSGQKVLYNGTYDAGDIKVLAVKNGYVSDLMENNEAIEVTNGLHIQLTATIMPSAYHVSQTSGSSETVSYEPTVKVVVAETGEEFTDFTYTLESSNPSNVTIDGNSFATANTTPSKPTITAKINVDPKYSVNEPSFTVYVDSYNGDFNSRTDDDYTSAITTHKKWTAPPHAGAIEGAVYNKYYFGLDNDNGHDYIYAQSLTLGVNNGTNGIWTKFGQSNCNLAFHVNDQKMQVKVKSYKRNQNETRYISVGKWLEDQSKFDHTQTVLPDENGISTFEIKCGPSLVFLGGSNGDGTVGKDMYIEWIEFTPVLDDPEFTINQSDGKISISNKDNDATYYVSMNSGTTYEQLTDAFQLVNGKYAVGQIVIKVEKGGTDEWIPATSSNENEETVTGGAAQQGVLTGLRSITIGNLTYTGDDINFGNDQTLNHVPQFYGVPAVSVIDDATGNALKLSVNNQPGFNNLSTATFEYNNTTYTITYRYEASTTATMETLSNTAATTWDFSKLQKNSYMITDWTWNENITFYASATYPMSVTNSGYINVLGPGAASYRCFALNVPGAGTFKLNGYVNGERKIILADSNGTSLIDEGKTIYKPSTNFEDFEIQYTGAAQTIYIYITNDKGNGGMERLNTLTFTPEHPLESLRLDDVEITVDENFTFGGYANWKPWVTEDMKAEYLADAEWTSSATGTAKFNNKNKGVITGVNSNENDNATAQVTLTLFGQTATCTVTVKRASLKALIDHIAFTNVPIKDKSSNTIAKATEQELDGYVYVTAKNGRKKLDSTNYTLTAEYKATVSQSNQSVSSGSSAIATFSDKKLRKKSDSPSAEETWTVTATPKETTKYKSTTCEIRVSCSNYAYSPTATLPAGGARRYVTHDNTSTTFSSSMVTMISGSNPAGIYLANNDTNTDNCWGNTVRKSQERDSYGNSYEGSNVRGWENYLLCANPQMNALREQHRLKTSTDPGSYNDKFYYYSYTGVEEGSENEFNVPVMGSFYRFVPKGKGKLVVYLQVNGPAEDSNYKGKEDGPNKCGDRRLYILNPDGTVHQNVDSWVQPASCMPRGFFCTKQDMKSLSADDQKTFKRNVEQLLEHWTDWGNDLDLKPVDGDTDEAKRGKKSFTDINWQKFNALANDPEGVHFQLFKETDGSFVALAKCYAKFMFEVQPGMVYFTSPTATKTRLSGIEFVPDPDWDLYADQSFAKKKGYVLDGDGELVEQTLGFSKANYIEDVDFYEGQPKDGTPSNTNIFVYESGKNNSWVNSANNGKCYNVTLKDRGFEANTWYSFCLPFDVSEEEIINSFGPGVKTLHFDKITVSNDQTNLYFVQHYYNKIRAGRPIFIRMPEQFPDKDGTGPKTELEPGEVTFYGVTFNNSQILNIESKNGNNTYTFTGSYWATRGTETDSNDYTDMPKNNHVPKNSYFISLKETSEGETVATLYKVGSVYKTSPGNRAWIETSGDGKAPKVSLNFFNQETDEEVATAIENLIEDGNVNVIINRATDHIYNLNGQVVGTIADKESLPAGMYIVNGKKLILK